MSFTDGKQRIATNKECSMKWGLRPKGDGFRCHLCGHKFTPGDKYRWQYAVPHGVINFLVCEHCDGEDVLDRWIERNKEFQSDKFWALR